MIYTIFNPSNRLVQHGQIVDLFPALSDIESMGADKAWSNVCRGLKVMARRGWSLGGMCATGNNARNRPLVCLRIKPHVLGRLSGSVHHCLVERVLCDLHILQGFLLQVGLLLLSQVPKCGYSREFMASASRIRPLWRHSPGSSIKALRLALHFVFLFI